jgi:hypothetical protein
MVIATVTVTNIGTETAGVVTKPSLSRRTVTTTTIETGTTTVVRTAIDQ